MTLARVLANRRAYEPSMADKHVRDLSDSIVHARTRSDEIAKEIEELQTQI